MKSKQGAAALARRRWTMWAGVAGVLMVVSGCTKNVATGRSQFDVLSRDEEVAIGREAAPQLTQEYGGAVTDPRVNEYVTGVGMALARVTEESYRDLPWKFTLLNSPVVNAFALPGGQVFISRGLAEKFTSEAQLAGVLGHEIGHVTAEHGDQAIARGTGIQVLAGVGSVLARGDSGLESAVSVLVSGAGVFNLKFSRDQENEADKLGMRYMVRAKYNPRGMLEVMRVLAAESRGGGGGEMFSTHPSPETRIGIIDERLRNNPTYSRAAADPGFGTFEERFRSEFLERMRSIPAPAAPRQSGLDLRDPSSWCAHCAAARGEG